ncbi:MAG TPA: hypothetical protein VF310_14560 [Vicinamibacteria bacterium]
MRRRETLAALWVVLHLLLVLLGALEALPLPRRPGSPWHWLAAYTEYTGAGNDYSFFSPAVGSQIRVRLLRTDGSGATREIHLDTANREVNFRIGCMLLASMKVDEIRGPMARSWASLVMGAGPEEASRVEVVVESYHLPSMADYRAGERGAWQEIYRGEFEARPPRPAAGGR